MIKSISIKNGVFISLVGPPETGKLQFIYTYLTIGTFQLEFVKFFFINTPSHFRMLCKKTLKMSSFFWCVNFEFIDSLENNGTKNLIIFDKSCEEICILKAFVDIATAG